jgi:hypothetical protein
VFTSYANSNTESYAVSPYSAEIIKEATGYYDEFAGVGCNSNSSWRQTMQPIIVGTHRLFPLSIEMEQRLILHYLGPTSEYQDVCFLIPGYIFSNMQQPNFILFRIFQLYWNIMLWMLFFLIWTWTGLNTHVVIFDFFSMQSVIYPLF